MACLLALDQGTSSSRAIVFSPDGEILAMAQRELAQIYPQAGWVEHDPMEIWQAQLEVARAALAKAQLAGADIAAIGITNQRETTVVWNRRTGLPIHNAIVWQDRRGEAACASLRARGLEQLVSERTGLRIDAYFSATKISWILDHVPGARAAAQRGELAFGTIDSWLTWQLTGGRVHVTDVSNASRTMLFDIRSNRWDEELLALLAIPPAMLPTVHPSSHCFGETDGALFGRPLLIGGIAGDQQAALFGQACFRAGLAKNTYGTGCFMLAHTGAHLPPSPAGIIRTAAAQASASPAYALEGSVFIGGAVVQWLRDGLGAVRNATEAQQLAASVPDSGGVLFVPALTGLGAPYWQPHAKGAIVGLSRGSTVAHIARAALEAIAFQSTALLQAMNGGAPERSQITELRVDGGASVNDALMQFQADLLGIPVVRPKVSETTALGVAYLAGLACQTYSSLDQLALQWQAGASFYPNMTRAHAAARMEEWEHAVRQACLSPA